MDWALVVSLSIKQTRKVQELPKYPAVQRDLALIVKRELNWEQVLQSIQKDKNARLKEVRLFDIFESEKLGKDKKSLAVNFTFLDEEKTLTDKEIDGWMQKIMTSLETDLQAEIRK